MHAARGLQAGASEEKIRQLGKFRASELFDERERAALELAERMTISGQRVDDELFARVRKHFSEDEAVEPRMPTITWFSTLTERLHVSGQSRGQTLW